MSQTIVVAQRMWQRRDTAANWTSRNPVLAAGEIGVELPAGSDTLAKFKIGTGVHPWNGLPYAGLIDGVAMLAGADFTGHVSVGGSNFYAHPTLPRIGVGTDDPQYGVHVTGPSAGIYLSREHATQEPFILLALRDDLDTGGQVRGLAAGGLRFTNGGGNVTWGRIAPDGLVVGVPLIAEHTNGLGLVVSRTNHTLNSVIEFRTTNGSCYAGARNGANWAVGASSNLGSAPNRWMNVTSTSIISGEDNRTSLGVSAARFSVVYAATGSINTSDAREKTPPRDMTESEIAAGLDIARLPCIYQWLDAIDLKGEEGARLHAGPTVQAVISVMQQHGLDPFRYGFICYDSWPEQKEEWADIPEERDDEGNVIREAERILVHEYRAAGDRYSLRPDELHAFCRRALVSDRDALLARIEALEQRSD